MGRTRSIPLPRLSPPPVPKPSTPPHRVPSPGVAPPVPRAADARHLRRPLPPVLRRVVLGVLLGVLPWAAACGDASPGSEGAHGHDEHGSESHGGEPHADDAHGHDEHETEPHGDEPHGDDEHGHGDHDRSLVTLDPRAVERAAITTAAARRESLPDTLATTGKVGYDERLRAHVTPRLPGRVQRVTAELGDDVARGEILALLDSVVLGEAKAAYLRARAREEVARSHAERERRLFADRISSELAAQEAEAHAREAAADLAAAASTLRLYGLAAADLQGLSYDDPDLSLLTVRAPFSGRVVERNVALGEMAQPEDELFTVADLSQVWVWMDLYERELRHVAVGDRVEVRVDAWPGETFAGRVAFVGDEVDADSRTLRARVDLPNPGGRLRPGMFARVSLERAPARNGAPTSPALTIPAEAVQRGDAGPVVFVAASAAGAGEGDGAPAAFRRQPVRLGRSAGDRVEVLEGLEEGDPVVVEGAFLLESQASADELGGHHH